MATAKSEVAVVVRLAPKNPVDHRDWRRGEDGLLVGVDKEGKQLCYKFDELFDQSHENADVYKKSVKSLVASAVDGFNVTVAAYGQSGSGKTHTLLGTDTEKGLLHYAVDSVFQHIEQRSERKYLLSLMCVEVYNENVHDLLSESDVVVNLKLFDKQDTCSVSGALEPRVSSVCDVFKHLSVALDRRKIGATGLNNKSSRSHALFQLTIESCDAQVPSAFTVSRLVFVDLAGSENAKAANSTQQSVEGGNINKSLLALGTIISSLADEGMKSQGLSFRTSKLTRLLKTAFGGNSKTLMVCCIHPTPTALTSSTLKFARQVKKVKNEPVKNESQNESHLAQYLKQIEDLKKQLAEKDERETKMHILSLRNVILNDREDSENKPLRSSRRHSIATASSYKPLSKFMPPQKRHKLEVLQDLPENVPSSRNSLESFVDFMRRTSEPEGHESLEKSDDSSGQTNDEFCSERHEEEVKKLRGEVADLQSKLADLRSEHLLIIEKKRSLETEKEEEAQKSRNEVANLQSELTKMHSDHLLITDKYRSLEAKKEEEDSTMRCVIEELHKRLASSSEEREELLKKIDQLGQENSDASRDSVAFHQQLLVAHKEKEDLCIEMHRLTETVENLTSENRESKKRVLKSEKNLEVAHKYAEAIKKDLAELIKQSQSCADEDSLRIEIARLGAELRDSLEERSKMKSEYEENIEKMKIQTSEQVENLMQKLESERALSLSDLEKLGSEKNALEKLCSDLKESQSSTNEGSPIEIARLGAELRDSLEESSRLKSEYEETIEKMKIRTSEQVEKLMEELESERAVFLSDSDKFKNEKNDLEKLCSDLRGEITILTSRLGLLDAQIAEERESKIFSEEAVSQKKQQNCVRCVQLDVQIRNLEEKVKLLNAEYSFMKSKIESEQSKSEQLSARLTEMRDEMHEKLAEKEEKLHKYRNRIAELDSSLKRSEAQKKDLSNWRSEIDEKNRKLEEKLQREIIRAKEAEAQAEKGTNTAEAKEALLLQVEDLQKRLSDAISEKDAAEDLNLKLQADVFALRTKSSEAAWSSEKWSLEKKIRDFESEMRELRDQLDVALNSKPAVVTKTDSALIGELQDLRSRIKDLEQKSAEKTAEIELLYKQKMNGVEYVKELKRRIAELEK
ncbi:unnamed protein product [Caenorhabditis auriculariae]|uniref:Kinesin motor domain-containing protein n=1 Tax=Caenorhabditis auriculariae TaxID=2777116 RepID=A0A8S1HD01_9PELO|nr:unnamed protein product [Caenorhabditis auriculariae]